MSALSLFLASNKSSHQMRSEWFVCVMFNEPVVSVDLDIGVEPVISVDHWCYISIKNCISPYVIIAKFWISCDIKNGQILIYLKFVENCQRKIYLAVSILNKKEVKIN